MPRRWMVALIVVGALGVLSMGRPAEADAPVSQIRFQNGHFEPASLNVAANEPFKVSVTNQDSAPIEFESFELHRERVVRPGETITVFIPALPAGNYEFFDDFNHQAPKGLIVSK